MVTDWPGDTRKCGGLFTRQGYHLIGERKHQPAIDEVAVILRHNLPGRVNTHGIGLQVLIFGDGDFHPHPIAINAAPFAVDAPRRSLPKGTVAAKHQRHPPIVECDRRNAAEARLKRTRNGIGHGRRLPLRTELGWLPHPHATPNPFKQRNSFQSRARALSLIPQS